MANGTPTLLFRVWSNQSNGLNTSTKFAPAANVRVNRPLIQDPAVGVLSITAEDLEKALRGDHFPDAPMTFFTSTFLFALVYAGYLRASGASNINITCVFTNTAKDSAGRLVRFHTIKSLMEKYDVVLKNKDQSVRQYEGESVAMADVCLGEGSCHVSYEMLISNGLYKLYPELDEVQRSHKPRWYLILSSFRKYWSENPRNLDAARINTAARLALCFKPVGGAFLSKNTSETTGLLMAWMLALRKTHDTQLDSWLGNGNSSLAQIEVGDTSIPEVGLYYELCQKIGDRNIYESQMGSDTDIDENSITNEILQWKASRRQEIDERRAARPPREGQKGHRRRNKGSQKKGYRRTNAGRIEKPNER